MPAAAGKSAEQTSAQDSLAFAILTMTICRNNLASMAVRKPGITYVPLSAAPETLRPGVLCWHLAARAHPQGFVEVAARSSGLG